MTSVRSSSEMPAEAVIAFDDGQAPGVAGTPTTTEIARLAVGATIANSLGATATVMAALGTLLVPIADEFGWSRTEVAGAFTSSALAAAITFPFAGRLADRYGTRPVLLIGFTLLGLTILALAVAPANHMTFYAMFALTGIAGTMASTMVTSKLISQWMDQKRGFWMGLTSGIGNAVGASAMPIVAAVLMTAYGWRTAFAGIGLGVLLIGVPVTYFLLHAPPVRVSRGARAAETGLSVGEAMRKPLFWLILSAVPIGAGALNALLANMVPIVTSRGLTLAQATGVIAAFAMICAVWKPLVGFMLDRTRRPLIVAPFYLLASCGAIALAHTESVWAITLAGLLAGIGLGAEFSVMLYILSRYFGLRAMGAIGGIAYTMVFCSKAVIPLALNLAFDKLGTYAPALYLIAAILVYNAVLFTFLKPYPELAKD